VNAALLDEFQALQSRRYTSRDHYRRPKSSRLEVDLVEGTTDGSREWLSDIEFLEKYRMTRDSFKALVELIKDHPVFKSKRGRKQAPVSYQLMVLLRYLATEGTGASNPSMRNLFGIGRGTAEVWKRRALTAIRSLRHRAVTWPDEGERKEIAGRFLSEYNWPHCVGLADGTLFPTCFLPRA